MGELFGEYHLLQQREPAAAPLLRPVRGEVPAIAELRTPPPMELGELGV